MDIINQLTSFYKAIKSYPFILDEDGMRKYTFKKSSSVWRTATKYIPGGVNSPVRAFKAVGGTPLFIKKGIGSKIYDIDGNAYVDYVCSWGPLIYGHSYPPITKEIKSALPSGTSFGAPTVAEVELARMLVDAIPSVDMVRLVNSGTEAVMSAIRLARAFTGRASVVKFEGCYHGHSDGMLVKAGSGAATLAVPTSPGVPKSYSDKTFVLPYNDADALISICRKRWREIACIIVEPIAGNMGVVLPRDGFLEEMRAITKKYGIVLIFDEVITGFRLCFGGAQNILGIEPDLTTLGKIIGGGMPIGAYGGRRDIMKLVSPSGPVYQAGTLSGNPVAVAAGLAVLRCLKHEQSAGQKDKPYKRMERMTSYLREGFLNAARSNGVSLSVNAIGSMFTPFFAGGRVCDFTSASRCNTKRYAKFFWGMLKSGCYFPPSQFETAFVSAVHTEADIDGTVNACYEIFRKL